MFSFILPFLLLLIGSHAKICDNWRPLAWHALPSTHLITWSSSLKCGHYQECYPWSLDNSSMAVSQLCPVFIQEGDNLFFAPSLELPRLKPAEVSVSQWLDIANTSSLTNESKIIPNDEDTEFTVMIPRRFLSSGVHYFVQLWLEDVPWQERGPALKVNITVRTHECIHPLLMNNQTKLEEFCNGFGECIAYPWRAKYHCLCNHSHTGKYCDEYNACWSNPCLNDGQCNDVAQGLFGDDFRCDCAPGFNGTVCGHNIDDCHGNRCQNNATCVDLVQSYNCSCVLGFTGTYCEKDIDECRNNPCVNGICRNFVGGYQCFCADGFTGQNCSIDYDDCSSNPCHNRSLCIDKVASYHCQCPPGYTGLHCESEFDECSVYPCSANSTTDCIDLLADYQCICQSGYSGKNCEINIDECASNPCRYNSKCTDQIDGYVCTCQPPYTGVNCAQMPCELLPCENGAVCHNNFTNLPSGFTCVCPPGYTGERCELNIDDCIDPIGLCSEHGYCIDGINMFQCLCQPGWAGDNCSQPINDCFNHQCRNNATCIDEHLKYSCACPPGFDGRFCEKEQNECASQPCANSATCLDLFNGFKCICSKGWTGTVCTEQIDECDLHDNPCLNGGTCLDDNNHLSCVCPALYTGRWCERKFDPCSPSYSYCKNGAACADFRNGSYACRCLNGFTGLHCEINIDECINTPCKNNASCEDLIAQYKCHCLSGFRGNLCEENIDDCLGHQCENNATCIDGINTYECACPTGLTGPYCTIDIDECRLLSPCVNGGSCINLWSSYKCTCPPGLTGRNCETEIYECLSRPCANGGICLDLRNAYKCVCPDDFTGKHCDSRINECESNPCAFGSCLDMYRDFFCECQAGWTGKLCDENINDCLNITCFHGGKCVDQIHSFSCSCAPGFSGTYCETDMNVCTEEQCLNNGTCVEGIGNKFTCRCRQGFTGTHCEQNIDDCMSQPCQNFAHCQDEIANYTCVCRDGFVGRHCEIDVNECAQNPCVNNGICHENSPGEGYSCFCKPGWGGVNCSLNYDDCAPSPVCLHSGTCIDSLDDFSCICLPRFTGKRCEIDLEPTTVYPTLESTTLPASSTAITTEPLKSTANTQTELYRPTTSHKTLTDKKIHSTKLTKTTEASQTTDSYTTESTAHELGTTQIHLDFNTTDISDGYLASGLLPNETTTLPYGSTGILFNESKTMEPVDFNETFEFDNHTTRPITTESYHIDNFTAPYNDSMIGEYNNITVFNDTIRVTSSLTSVDSKPTVFPETTLELKTVPVIDVLNITMTTTSALSSSTMPTDSSSRHTAYSKTQAETTTSLPTTTSAVPSEDTTVGLLTTTKKPEKDTLGFTDSTLIQSTVNISKSSYKFPTTDHTQTTQFKRFTTMFSTSGAFSSTQMESCAILPCRNNGTCLDQATADGASFKCVCLHDFEGKYCEKEKKFPSLLFTGDTVLRFKNIQVSTQSWFSITIRSIAPDGIILHAYNANGFGAKHSLLLYMQYGLITFEFDCLISRYTLKTKLKVNDGSPHRIVVRSDWNRCYSSLTVKNLIKNTTEFTSDGSSFMFSVFRYKHLDKLLVGGYGSKIVTGKPTRNFTGCASEIVWNGGRLNTKMANFSVSYDICPAYTDVTDTSYLPHPDACAHIDCANGGVCVSENNLFHCQCPWSFTGRYCELTDSPVLLPKFSGHSFLIHKQHLSSKNATIELSIFPLSNSGSVFSTSNDDGLFVHLYLKNGFVRYRQGCPGGKVLYVDSQYKVRNKKFEHISISYNMDGVTCLARLSVNGRFPVISSAFLGFKPFNHSDFDTFYVGGMPWVTSFSNKPSENFTGCMNRLRIDRKHIDIALSAIDGWDIQECDATLPCEQTTCLNNGDCISNGLSGWECQCKFPYSGRICQRHACDSFHCSNGSTCIADLVKQDTVCLCSYGKTGSLCQTETTIDSPEFLGTEHGFDSFLHFDPETTLSAGFQANFTIIPKQFPATKTRIVTVIHIIDEEVIAVLLLGRRIQLIRASNLDSIRLTSNPIKSNNSHHGISVAIGHGEISLAVNNVQTKVSIANGISRARHVELYIGGIERLKKSPFIGLLSNTTGFVGCIFNVKFRPLDKKSFIKPTKVISGRSVNECSLEKCFADTCKNGGRCVLLSSNSYKCSCSKQFTAPLCLDKINPCNEPNVCSKGAVCTNTRNGSHFCNCPLGKTGAKCEYDVVLTDASFTGTHSFLNISLFKQVFSVLHLRISFKPKSLSGLLFKLHSPLQRQTVSMVMKDGVISVQIDSPRFEKSVFVQLNETLNLDTWHFIELNLTETSASLFEESYKIMYPTVMSPYRFSNILVGGLPDVNGGLVGCVRQLQINGFDLPLTKADGVTGWNVQDCDGTACGYNVCHRLSACQRYEGQLGYRCLCPQLYTGPHCDQHILCHNHRCLNGATCLANGDAFTYTCLCPLAWHGRYCEHMSNYESGYKLFGVQSSFLELATKACWFCPGSFAMFSMQFRTTSRYGLLLFYSETSYFHGDDFIVLYLQNANLMLEWRNGFTNGRLTTFEQLSDEKWHTISLQRRNMSFLLSLDGRIYLTSLKEDLVSASTLYSASSQFVLFFGSMKTRYHKISALGTAPLFGCLKSLEIHGIKVNEGSLTGSNVESCSQQGI